MEVTDIIIVAVLTVVMGLALSAAAIFLWRRTVPPQSLLGPAIRLAAIVGGVILGLLTLLVMFGVLGPFAPVWGVVALFVVAEVVRQQRLARQFELLWLLTLSAERAMPLTPAVAAFARRLHGLLGRRARRLAAMLEEGVPLPDALDRCRGLVPRQALPLIRVGWESGRLASGLRRAAAAHRLNMPILAGVQGRIGYLLLVPAYGAVIVIFIMLKIVPALQKIFQDFETALPPMTQFLFTVMNLAGRGGAVLMFGYLFVLALVVYGSLRWLGWIRWELPGLGRLTRRLDSAQVLDALALNAAAERPMTEGLAALARSYPKRSIRRRLVRAQADIQRGCDWSDSLRRQGLIRQPEVVLIRSAQRVGNLAWAMTEMADSARRRYTYRVQALIQVLFPPLVVAMGLAVMFIVVALFLPLVTLIQKMAD